eukprot:m.188756 g.188756  ORF g.188756 m.188756 type:complete len:167 (+) comp39393_c2_seq4:351-851(+)
MPSVRTRKARKRVKANSTKPAVKKKKQKRIKLGGVLGKAYDEKKTMKENFTEFGLALDPNEGLLVEQKVKMAVGADAEAEKNSKQGKSKGWVIEALEREATRETKRRGRHIAPGEVKFLSNLIEKYGEDYKAMARDETNWYQHTPNQIRRRCQAFLLSSSSSQRNT